MIWAVLYAVAALGTASIAAYRDAARRGRDWFDPWHYVIAGGLWPISWLVAAIAAPVHAARDLGAARWEREQRRELDEETFLRDHAKELDDCLDDARLSLLEDGPMEEGGEVKR